MVQPEQNFSFAQFYVMGPRPLEPLNTIVLLWSEGGLSSGDASLSDSCTPDCL